MATGLKFNFELKESPADVYNLFINETKEGKYTDLKPEITQISYGQVELQDLNAIHELDETVGDVMLYGISF